MYRHPNNTAHPARQVAARSVTIGQPTVQAPADRASDWQAHAVAAYQQTQRDQAVAMPQTLAARIHALTGRTIALDAIFVDAAAGLATAVLDGEVFRLRGQQVVILRSCSECGNEHFESPPLTTRADLGYALSAWQPLCAHCQPEDPVNWLESD